MKNSIHYHFVLLAAGTLLPAGALVAQTAAPANTPSVSVPAGETATTTTEAGAGKHGDGKMKERLAQLTPEERQKLKAAREKALQDPAVKAAEANRETDKKGFHRAMREAMVKADPSIVPILEKLRPAGRKHGE